MRPCAEVFSDGGCWWNFKQVNCCDVFELQRTEFGLCHSFNSDFSEYSRAWVLVIKKIWYDYCIINKYYVSLHKIRYRNVSQETRRGLGSYWFVLANRLRRPPTKENGWQRSVVWSQVQNLLKIRIMVIIWSMYLSLLKNTFSIFDFLQSVVLDAY